MARSPAERVRRLADVSGAVQAAAWSIVGAAVVTALYIGRDLLIPISLALLLSFVLSPLVSLAKRARIPRSLAVVCLVVLAFGVIFGIGAIFAGQVSQLAGDLPKYQSTMQAKVQSVGGYLGGSRTLERAAGLLQDLSRELDRPQPAASSRGGGVGQGPDRPAQTPVLVEIRQPDPTSLDNLRALLEPLLHPMATTGVIAIFVIFILLQREDLRNRFMALAGARDIQRTTAALDDAARRLSRFLLTQLVLNSGFGLAIGFGLWAIGVPSAALWGIMAAVLRFVPYVGAVIAAIFPMLLAAAVDPGWTKLAMTAALFGVVEPLVGHVVEPMAYGRSTGLSPVAVVVAATFWTVLWGPIGLVLATPLTVCLVVLGRHVESLSFLEMLFGDRPALSPPEIFYQRMLARDPAEASEKAAEFLKERTLSDYYEEVALPGLLLAQHDAERGEIEGERLATLRSSVFELVEDLEPWRDRSPDEAPTRDPEAIDAIESVDGGEDRGPKVVGAPGDGTHSAFRVRCVGARTPVEEGAAAIVAQMLRKHGLDPEIEDEDFLLTSGVVEMESAGPSIVCAAFLDESEAQLRLVVRRLRRRLPHSYLVAGFWTSRDRGVGREALERSSKADVVAFSLREAVEACAAEAWRRAAKPVGDRPEGGPQTAPRRASAVT